MAPFPDIITHTYHPGRGPCRNVCTLPLAEAERILDEMRRAGSRLKPSYLRRRLFVEDWLISERRRKLGAPHLKRPVYCFLGDFSDGMDPSRPLSLIMALSLFAPDMLTFTYPDSMASLPISTAAEHSADRRPYHGRVFTLDEIKSVVAEFGMPDRAAKYDRFIEVQVWDDRPIRKLMGY